MAFLALLWLPILVSAVLVFLLSALSHIFVPYRQKEWDAAPEQGAIQQSLRGAKPGLYVFPSPANNKDRGKPEEARRWAEGPSGFLTLAPLGPINFPRNLGLSFLINVLVSVAVAYVAAHSLGHAPRSHAVVRLVGTIGFLAYCVGPLYEAVWYWKPWRSLAMTAADALAFGLAMAGIFAWLWPR